MNNPRRFVLSLILTLAIVSPAAAQTGAPGDRFQQLDKSKDGFLTPDEFAVEKLFQWLDKDGDGKLTPAEAAAFRAGKSMPADESAAPAAPAGASKPRPHGDEATQAGLKPDVLARLDTALQQAVANKEISGVIGLIHRNGQRGYFEAFGWQDIEAQKPLATDALFRLQSMSKPVVSACALALYDEGLFKLDEPISKHCPEWAQPQVLEDGQLVPAKFAITPRMLMSHSSGLYYGDIQQGARSKAGHADAGIVPAIAANRASRTSLKALSESLASQPLKFHPGTSYQYGHSIDVLGRYIEAVADQPLDVVLQERILGPLKMTSTDFWVHPENAERICQIYKQPKPGVLERGRDAGQLTTKPTLFMGGQGLCSSTEDYERFCLMMLNRGELDGVRVLKAETVDLMFENHLKPELGQQYGLGGVVDGEGGYSWGGANGTQFWLDRKNKLFAIYMVQTQLYKAPTYGAFKALVNESAGIVAGRGPGAQGQGGGAGALTSQFKQRDKNNDGKLSRDELPAALFDRLDADKDGFVTEKELKALRKPE
jgi:CubicO group peptidase (beta-lactamase class C family)